MSRTDVDAGARGLFEQNEDAYGLCTEAVGCESCEMRMDDVEEAAAAESGGSLMRKVELKSDHRFPPPISCLAGGRRKFLRRERRDGRLVLTEMKMERPKVFCTSRKDGRLRLELVVEEEEELEPETEDVYEGEEKRRWERVRSERFRRCQEMMNGEPWCHQRFVSTA